MRVLSRRSKFAKAVACGYPEGAGFVVLTEPSSSCRPLCATRGRPVDAALARYGPGPEGVRTRLCLWVTLTRCQSGPHQQRGPSALRRGVATTLRRRRRAVPRAQDRALGCVPTPARPVTSPPISNSSDGVERRRLLSTTKTSAPPRRRRLRRLRPCGFSHSSSGYGHCWLTARRHKHCSTAAATTAGVAHRSLHCTRDRERCTES